tara:strand:+ start:12783 stop:13085 length:303 start_codon:yes stop_codon:yes gene_type:complete
MSETAAGQRIDLWLWHARFFKTRSLATTIVSKGRMRITANGTTRRVTKPATLLRIGDTLTFLRNDRVARITILALADRRGSAVEAQALYTALDDETADAR